MKVVALALGGLTTILIGFGLMEKNGLPQRWREGHISNRCNGRTKNNSNTQKNRFHK